MSHKLTPRSSRESASTGGAIKAIVADPPWSFVTWSKKNQTRAAENHYDVMNIDDIYAIPVVQAADTDCVLFLWSINSMLPQALTTIERWGFAYKTVAFTWAKRAPRNGTVDVRAKIIRAHPDAADD